MDEQFLSYLWQTGLYLPKSLEPRNEDKIEILHPGEKNIHAGPDFFNVKVRRGNVTWAGNLEIHVKSSDWNLHGHQHDETYNNVILHLVAINNEQVFCKNGRSPLTIELNYNNLLLEKYTSLKECNYWTACKHDIQQVDPFILTDWMSALAIERLNEKTDEIIHLLETNNQHWEETFYQVLSKNFGFKVNALPFELLSRSVPLNCLSKHKNNLLQLEAMLFGQAGFLNEAPTDEYTNELAREYALLKHKFNLQPIDVSLWKFLRLRPVNFPLIRISQLATLIHQSSHLFSKIMEAEKTSELLKLFDVSASSYWNHHYHFGKVAGNGTKHIGTSSIENILINTVIPFIFCYGRKKGDNLLKEKSLHFLEDLSAENNNIIRDWAALGIKSTSAFDSQALIQLKNAYCMEKRCLNCRIGNKIFYRVNGL